MTTKNKLEYVEIAKGLTESKEIDVLIDAAKKLIVYDTPEDGVYVPGEDGPETEENPFGFSSPLNFNESVPLVHNGVEVGIVTCIDFDDATALVREAAGNGVDVNAEALAGLVDFVAASHKTPTDEVTEIADRTAVLSGVPKVREWYEGFHLPGDPKEFVKLVGMPTKFGFEDDWLTRLVIWGSALKSSEPLVEVITEDMNHRTLFPLYALWEALTWSRQRINIVGPQETLDQAKEVIDKALAFIGDDVQLIRLKDQITFENGAMIRFHTPDQIKHYFYKGACDEKVFTDLTFLIDAGHYSENDSYLVRDFVGRSVIGERRVVAVSTPGKAKGAFWDMVTNAIPSLVVQTDCRDHPKWDIHWASTKIKEIGEERFRREYCGYFTSVPKIF